MVDIFSKKKRSQIMAAVRNKNTKPEVCVRKALFGKGYRYKVNDKTLPGSPDIVLPKYNTAIFVHGCFWHGHKNCIRASKPKSNIDFWESKIQNNIDHDKFVKRELNQLGWIVITIWGCELKNQKIFNRTINKLITKL